MEEFFNWLVKNKDWLFNSVGALILLEIVHIIFKRNRANSKQTSRAGNGSTIYQAGRDVKISNEKINKNVEND